MRACGRRRTIQRCGELLKEIDLSKVSVRTPRPSVRLRRVSRGSSTDAYEARHDGAPPAPTGSAEEWDELPGAGIQIALGGLDEAAIDFRQRRGILNHPGGDRIDGGGLRGGSFLLGGGEGRHADGGHGERSESGGDEVGRMVFPPVMGSRSIPRSAPANYRLCGSKIYEPLNRV